MYRTHNCGELRLENKDTKVTLSGWVQKTRKMGGMTFIDLRDRYGITQLVFNKDTDEELCDKANKIGREFVIQVSGLVQPRSNMNKNIPTGEIEIIANDLIILNKSETPPFIIEDDTDGGDDLRMKYRYLDLRRSIVRKNLELRHKLTIGIRKYLDDNGFLEVETPILIGSTPEGARDFIVPSRMNQGEFYALPQSPQLFKQLLMVSGFDKYFQIAKCFRDEDLRADRQPEFTQIDCEMSFVEQEDVITLFEDMSKKLFKDLIGYDLGTEPFLRMTYADAQKFYGSDKPDLRFAMKFVELKDVIKEGKFKIFDSAEYIGAICAEGCASYSRKQLDKLTDFVKRPQVGAKGLVYVKVNNDGSFKSSVDKFYDKEDLSEWAKCCNAKPGDLILILSGDKNKTRASLNSLRLEMGNQLNLRSKNVFAPLWVVDFPMFEFDEELGRFQATHHPFTAPKEEDIPLLDTDPGKVRANAYDMIINGVELGGGSIRIHDSKLQAKAFEVMGFTKEKAMSQFGFLMNAFKYGAPPHGGLAFGLDRYVSMLAGLDSIRDCIAFPKNTSGRDVMCNAPSQVDSSQLEELNINVKESK